VEAEDEADAGEVKGSDATGSKRGGGNPWASRRRAHVQA